MYVDGFIVAVKTARKDDYVAMAQRFATLAKAHGALSIVEAWADDVTMGEVTSFPRAVQLEADETAVFSWITYPDRATRDACSAAIMAEPGMEDAMDKTIMDGRRMIFGGFQAIVNA